MTAPARISGIEARRTRTSVASGHATRRAKTHTLPVYASRSRLPVVSYGGARLASGCAVARLGRQGCFLPAGLQYEVSVTCSRHDILLVRALLGAPGREKGFGCPKSSW